MTSGICKSFSRRRRPFPDRSFIGAPSPRHAQLRSGPARPGRHLYSLPKFALIINPPVLDPPPTCTSTCQIRQRKQSIRERRHAAADVWISGRDTGINKDTVQRRLQLLYLESSSQQTLTAIVTHKTDSPPPFAISNLVHRVSHRRSRSTANRYVHEIKKKT